MRIDQFKKEFIRAGGVYATDKLVLFRNPLELYSLASNRVIAQFGSVEEALAYEVEGRTLEDRIKDWSEISFPLELDTPGRGSATLRR